MASNYSGFQQGMTRLEVDPITGQMVPVSDMEEVSPDTKHDHSPLGQMFAADKTNIGVYAALAAALGGAGNSLAGGGGAIPGGAPAAASGLPTGPLAGVSPFVGAPNIGTGAASLAGPAAAGGGATALKEVAKQGGQQAAKGSSGMGFKEMAGLTALGTALDMLGGAFGDDEDGVRKSFEGTGPWSDPIQERQRANEMGVRLFNSLAKRSATPVGHRGLPKYNVPGLGDFGSSAGSPIEPLDFGVDGASSMTDWLDNMIRQNGSR